MLLSVRDLSVRIVGSRNALAVDGVSFDIEAGRSFGLVGESGCGKTTTAKAVLGLLPTGLSIASGSIRFRGAELVGMSRKEMNRLRWRDISLITQSAMNALNPVVRVGAQISEAIRAHESVDAREAAQRAEALFAKVSLDPALTRRYPHEFSGGMRQRAIIAMALACNPALIIADEPTTALDVIIQDEVFELLSEVRREGHHALLLISHDLSLVAENCDRVAVMYAGRIVETGPSAEVFERPVHPYTIGLQSAFPDLDGERRELISIPGSPPTARADTVGCCFSARCPFSQRICHDITPQTVSVSSDHLVSCHFPAMASQFRVAAQDIATWERPAVGAP